MDPLYYTRIAMAGWIFMAVVLGSLWSINSPLWIELVQLTQKDTGTITVVIFGAIIGIGAPPALGFLLERLSSMILSLLKANMWNYPSTVIFGKAFDEVFEEEKVINKKSGAAAFHVFFYTFADSKLLNWARRRRTQMYASLTSALSIVFALFFSIFVLNALSWFVLTVSIIVIVGLTVHSIRERTIHEQTITMWVNTFGAKALNEFSTNIISKKHV